MALDDELDPAQPAPVDPITGAPLASATDDAFIDQVNAEPLPAPVSGAMPDDAAWPPPVPPEAPGMVPPPTQAERMGTPVGGAEKQYLDAKPKPTAEGNIKAQGDLENKKAEREALDAAAAAEEADRHARQVESDRIDALATRQEAQDRLDARIAEYDQSRTLRDPRSSWSTVDMVRNKVGVLFGALGASLSAAGGGSGDNKVLEQINHRLQLETDRQKFNIGQAQDAVVMARTGLKDADDARRQLIADEDAKHVSRLNTIIAQGTASLKAQGVPAAKIATDGRLVALEAQRAAVAAKAHDDAVKNAEIEARTKLYLKKAGATGTGGGGGNEAKIAKAIEDGATPSQVRTLAAQLGVNPKRVDALETQGRAAAAAAAKNGGGDIEQNPLGVRDANGTVRGLASSSRVVKAMQDRAVQYDQAVESLEQLLAARKASSLPSLGVGDPAYDKAVLAIASVTQANASDKTTAHEAGTLKKYGLINEDAINSVLADIKHRRDAFMKQLRPIPGPKEQPEPGSASPAAGAKAESKGEPALPPGAVPAVKDGRPGIILNGAFHARR